MRQHNRPFHLVISQDFQKFVSLYTAGGILTSGNDHIDLINRVWKLGV